MTKPAKLLFALCCIVWLHGCASAPRVITVPSVCPAQREQPSKLMGELPDKLPALAESLPKNWGPDQAADALQQVRRESAAAYAACYESRAGLIDWISSQP